MYKAFIEIPESSLDSCDGCYFEHKICPEERECLEHATIYVEDTAPNKVEFEVDE